MKAAWVAAVLFKQIKHEVYLDYKPKSSLSLLDLLNQDKVAEKMDEVSNLDTSGAFVMKLQDRFQKL